MQVEWSQVTKVYGCAVCGQPLNLLLSNGALFLVCPECGEMIELGDFLEQERQREEARHI